MHADNRSEEGGEEEKWDVRSSRLACRLSCRDDKRCRVNVTGRSLRAIRTYIRQLEILVVRSLLGLVTVLVQDWPSLPFLHCAGVHRS